MDYLDDQRVSLDYVPDWLLEPPPCNNAVYLQKKELTSRIPYTVQLLYSYSMAKRGKQGEEFEARTRRELLSDVQQDKRKRLIAERMEKGLNMIGSGSNKAKESIVSDKED